MHHMRAFKKINFWIYVMQYVQMSTFYLCNQKLIKQQICIQDRSEWEMGAKKFY